jgi:hypothetical protein
MRVLFVGEGATDIGHGSPARRRAGPPPVPVAGGVVTELAQRVLDGQLDRPCALARDRFPGRLDKKVLAAALRAKAGAFDALVFVHDADRHGPRVEKRLRAGSVLASKRCPELAVVVAVAIETVEAWTLGARGALADVLDLDEKSIAELVPRDVETLSSNSQKPKRNSKTLVRLLAARARMGHLEFVEEVARRTNPGELEVCCPKGFAPFAEGLRSKIGTIAQEGD